MGQQSGINIPSNVRNFTPRIGGFDARKISSLVLLFILSAIIFHFSVLASIVVATGGVILILVPYGEEFFPSIAIRDIILLLRRKTGNIKVETSIECSSGVCIFRDRNRIFSVIEVSAMPFQVMTPDEIIAEAVSVSGTIDRLTSDIEVVSFPVRANSLDYLTGGSDENLMDYDGLIAFLISDAIFHKPYFFLSFIAGHGFLSSSDTLKTETEALRDGLQRAGINAMVIRTPEAGREIIEMMK